MEGGAGKIPERELSGWSKSGTKVDNVGDLAMLSVVLEWQNGRK